VVHRQTPTSRAERVCRYANAAVQQLMPDDLQRMFRESDDRAVDESLCVLYVALTRAVRTLHMIIDPPGERQRLSPMDGLLVQLLRSDRPAPATVVYQRGDPGGSAPDPDSSAAPARAAEAATADLVIRLAPATRRIGVARRPARV
jgi:ATP-dependent exoDNAse (exonuclease V) beta subunit